MNHIIKVFALTLILTAPLSAQTFQTLHSFSITQDGANPEAGVILSGTQLYGTTWQGGTNGFGTLYAVNTDGKRYSVSQYVPID